MLLTKFFLPELRPNRVARSRLIERLNQSNQSPLVLVSAPAGFGKTSLVGEWVHTAGMRAAWVSLDASDNDPARFWKLVAEAMESFFPGVGENARELLSARQPPAAQVLLTALLNDLAVYTGNEREDLPACLVLDDLHQVTNASIHEGLFFLVERLPRQLHLILVGRSDPPLPLGRLRASGRLLEIRATDLRFTLAESLEFLNRVMELPLTSAQVQQLDERTEGWIAGLQLAGLAMQGWSRKRDSDNLTAFIDNFSGSDRYILDYLVEEVLSRLPEEVRTFLLKTSVLEQLCGPLCDAVTGAPPGSGQAMLERLERENLFLIPLDNHRTWYRYHHLFTDLLRHQLERHAVGPGAALHRQAAAWLADQGMLPEAIVQALRGQDFATAAGWIEAYSAKAIARGEYATLKTWIEDLPEMVLYARPRLLLQYAWTLVYLADMDRYERPLAAAERLWREQGDQTGLAEVLNFRADIAATLGEGDRAAELARQSLELLPDEDAFHRGISWMYLGSAAFLLGDTAEAHKALTTGKALCERSGNATGARQSALMLAQVYMAEGDLPTAARLLEEIQAGTGELPIYEGWMARLLLGDIRREWNRLEEAEEMLRRVLEGVEQSGQALYFHMGYLHLAQVLWEKGDPTGAQAAFAQHARLANHLGDPRVQQTGAVFHARQALFSGDLEAAWRWLEDPIVEPDEPVGFINEYFHLTLVRLWIRQGDVESRQALVLLDELEGVALSQQRMGSLIEIWLLRALALGVLQDSAGAGEALEKSLSLAQTGGYRRLYLDEGQPFFNLLARLARQPALSPKLREAISELRSFASELEFTVLESASRAVNQSLIEPLTAREIEVLRLIQAGLSNREIAGQLYLTLNTVKVHVKNIFAKLSVSNRTQAVHRAETLGLI